MDWYKLTTEQVVQELQTSPESGLTGSEARRRLEQVGPNELIEQAGKEPWRILLDQFKEVMVVILIIAAIVSAVAWATALTIGSSINAGNP